MTTEERLDYETVGIDSLFNAHYLTIDIGQPTDSTVALLVHRADTYGNNFIYDHARKTKRPIIHTRYNVLGCRHLDPALSYAEQAGVIAQWVADTPKLADVKLLTTLNVTDIGGPAARAFGQFKPHHFRALPGTPELLRSLLVSALNTDPVQIRIADGVQCRAEDLDMERCGDARAVGITLHRTRTRVIRMEL
jgi:hypothetical protein